MSTKMLFFGVIFAVSSCLINCSNPTENASKPGEYTCATTALGTLASYPFPVMDESFIYYIAAPDKICRININTGELQTQVLEIPSKYSNLSIDGDYIYLYRCGDERTIYRISKTLQGSQELIATFDNLIQNLSAGDNVLYLQFRNNSGTIFHGLFAYDIQRGKLDTLADTASSFFTDHDNVYWITGSMEHLKLWKKPHSGSTPTVLVESMSGFEKAIGSFVYYWDGDTLKRISKQSGDPECVANRAKIETFDDFTILDSSIYMTNLHGELKAFPLDSPSTPTVVIDKKGGYDDDDIIEWITTDGKALYWIAGPQDGAYIQDAEVPTLFKTIAKRKDL
jgi:hypothetical protein